MKLNNKMQGIQRALLVLLTVITTSGVVYTAWLNVFMFPLWVIMWGVTACALIWVDSLRNGFDRSVGEKLGTIEGDQVRNVLVTMYIGFVTLVLIIVLLKLMVKEAV